MKYKLIWKTEKDRHNIIGVTQITIVYAFFSIWFDYNWKVFLGILIILWISKFIQKDIKIKRRKELK